MKRALLVDLSSIYWSHWHSTKDEQLGAAFERTVQRVTAEASHYDYVAVCVDSPPYKRKQISADYKAQRDAPEPAAVEQLKRVKDRLVADGHCMWEAAGYEADDIIATAVLQWDTKEEPDPIEQVDILSSDKDLLQLVSEHVRTISVRDGKAYGNDEVLEKFGVHPSMMRDLLTLIGDSSDNIRGVPGVGPKHAARLLLEFGSIDELLKNADKIKPPSIMAKVVESGDIIRTSRQLVTLMTDAPIRWDDIFAERETRPLTEETMDAEFDEAEPEESDFDPISPPPQRTDPESESPKPEEAPPEKEDPRKRDRETTALVVAPAEWSMQLEPQSIGGAYTLAKGLYNSRLYTKFPNAEAIMAVIIRGRELGLGALTALDLMNIIEGKPSMSAHLIVGLVKKSSACEYFMCTSHDDGHATWETKRRGEPRPTSLKFTMDDAERAGLLRPPKPGKQEGQWRRRPKTMLRWSAGRELARLVYPDVVGGIVSDDEFESE